MSDERWFRSLFLPLLGMGVYFMIAALLSLAVWLAIGSWRSFLWEITLVAALTTIPTAYYLWNSYLIHYL